MEDFFQPNLLNINGRRISGTSLVQIARLKLMADEINLPVISSQ